MAPVAVSPCRRSAQAVVITFTDVGGQVERVIVSVKSGHVNAGMIRELNGTVEGQQTVIGVFLTLEEPTKPMKEEAAKAGTYRSGLWNRDYARIQFLSVADLLERKMKPNPPAFVHQPSRLPSGYTIRVVSRLSCLFCRLGTVGRHGCFALLGFPWKKCVDE